MIYKTIIVAFRLHSKHKKSRVPEVVKTSKTLDFSVVQLRGLEPLPTLSGLEPESSAYANSATTAKCSNDYGTNLIIT